MYLLFYFVYYLYILLLYANVYLLTDLCTYVWIRTMPIMLLQLFPKGFVPLGALHRIEP